MDKPPATLLEAIAYVSDAQRAHDHCVEVRFPNGVACPRHGALGITQKSAWFMHRIPVAMDLEALRQTPL
jgi:hypothetical protein